jgi:hypothetical protein
MSTLKAINLKLMTQTSGNISLPISALVRAWLIVGTLDIIAAIIQTFIGGGNITRLMQYIASGVFGPAAFEGGTAYAVMGLAFHYVVALGWSTLFFLIYPRLTFAPTNRLLTGIGYGILVWFMMNRVVLPLSNVKMGPFDVQKAIIAALVLIVAIGIPLSLMASKHFLKTKQP